jgi:AraC-like DNA-binding protein
MASFGSHAHPEFNVVVSLRGAVEVEQLGRRETVAAGESMVGSHPGISHTSRYLPGEDGCEAVNVTFDPQVLSTLRGGYDSPLPPGSNLRPLYLGKIQSARIRSAAEEITAEMTHLKLGYEAAVECLATRILVEVLRVWSKPSWESLPVATGALLPRRDHIRAFEFMRGCRKEDFRLPHLCRYLGISEESFTRLFRSSVGHTPASFYNQMLLEQGRDLLARGAGSVKEVAYALGFKTPSHFIAAFGKQFGQTPSDYRRSQTAATGNLAPTSLAHHTHIRSASAGKPREF